MKSILITALAGVVCAVSPAIAQSERPEPPERPTTVQLEHYWNWETAGSPQISPDGDTIIYTRRRVDAASDSLKSELWIMEADGERHRFLTDGGSVQWSPGGERIAFVRSVEGKPQVFTRFMDASGAESQITRSEARISGFQWSPDGERIAFMAQTPMDPAIEIEIPGAPAGAELTDAPMVTDRLNYRIDRQGLKEGYDHLFVVPSDGGTARQLTAGDWDARATFSGIPGGAWDWDPDGGSLIFDGDLTPEVTDASGISGIHRVNVSTGEITTLFDDGGNWAGPVVSPDGDRIAFSGNPASPVNYPAQAIMIIDADGSDVQVLLGDLPESPANMIWADNGRSLYYGMNFQGETQLRSLDLRGRERTLTEGVHRFSFSSMSEDGVAAGVLSSPTNTGNVAVARRGELSLLTDLNGDILDGVELGRTEEIWYESNDGTRVQGWVVYPPDFDPNRKYPMILSIHGGPHAMYGVNFNYQFQQWAADDYIVLYTNPRGSTGYSPEFANAIDNAYPGRADYEDLMSGVDALVARGYVDEANMFATGCSGGGVLTTWIVTQTDRFAAAAALCPVTNWISFTGQADISSWSFERFRPHYWEDPDLWLRHSPIMHAHQVTTPTLLMTGAQDLRTPLAQAEEFYANLRRRGVPSVLISMVGEYHGTTSIPSNMMRTQLYLDSWFKEHGTFADGEEDEDSAAED